MNIKKYRPNDLVKYGDKNIAELIKLNQESRSIELEHIIKGFYELLM